MIYVITILFQNILGTVHLQTYKYFPPSFSWGENSKECVLLIRIIAGKRPAVLAVDAGGNCLDIFFSFAKRIFSFFLERIA